MGFTNQRSNCPDREISRWGRNDAARKNVSQGGLPEPQFLRFMEHFTINKIDYGNASDELREFVKPFGLPYFHPAYANFSRFHQ